MGGQGTVMAAHGFKTVSHHLEMAGLVVADTDPVGDEFRSPGIVQSRIMGKADDHVEGEVDRVELDMGDRVHQGAAAGERIEPAARNLAGRHADRFRRPGRTVRCLDRPAKRHAAAGPGPGGSPRSRRLGARFRRFQNLQGQVKKRLAAHQASLRAASSTTSA